MKDWIIMLAIKIGFIGAAVSVVMLTGCSTVSGVGKDIQNASEWTQNKISGK